MRKHIIWSNRDLNVDDWKDFLEEEYPDVYDEYEQYRLIEEMNAQYLDDEYVNLDKFVDGRIIVIADLGLWHGRVSGYKILNRNIRDIFSTGEDYTEWYSDGHNIKATATHHDGTNYYEYRVIREDRNINKLLDALYRGEELTRKKLNYYTKSLHPYVAKVYGW